MSATAPDRPVGLLHDMIRQYGFTLSDCLQAFTGPGDAELAACATIMHGSDDLEMADPPVTSASDDGVWVLAWVWMANDEEWAP